MEIVEVEFWGSAGCDSCGWLAGSYVSPSFAWPNLDSHCGVRPDFGAIGGHFVRAHAIAFGVGPIRLAYCGGHVCDMWNAAGVRDFLGAYEQYHHIAGDECGGCGASPTYVLRRLYVPRLWAPAGVSIAAVTLWFMNDNSAGAAYGGRDHAFINMALSALPLGTKASVAVLVACGGLALAGAVLTWVALTYFPVSHRYVVVRSCAPHRFWRGSLLASVLCLRLW